MNSGRGSETSIGAHEIDRLSSMSAAELLVA